MADTPSPWPARLKRMAPYVIALFVAAMLLIPSLFRANMAARQTPPGVAVRRAEGLIDEADARLRAGNLDDTREMLSQARGYLNVAKEYDLAPESKADPMETGAKMLVSALVLTFGFALLMANSATDSTKSWAMSTIGTVVGFWLGSITK